MHNLLLYLISSPQWFCLRALFSLGLRLFAAQHSELDRPATRTVLEETQIEAPLQLSVDDENHHR